jgi:hypothetical protein
VFDCLPAIAQFGAKTQEVEPIWNDEDTRSFYEDLPQLRVLLPAVLFGDSKKDEAEVRFPRLRYRYLDCRN